MSIKYIRRYLATKLGCKIVVVYYGSRNRKERYEGYLFMVYPNVFVIKLLSNEIKSFTYVDILTKNIQIYI